MGSAPVWGLIFGSNGPSMAQSCGKRISFHCASWKTGRSAPGASPLKKRQPLLKLRRRSPERRTAVGAAGMAGTAARNKKTVKVAVENRLGFGFIFGPYRTFESYYSEIACLEALSKVLPSPCF